VAVVRPKLGEVWETNGAVLLIVATDRCDGWYEAPFVGLILHYDVVDDTCVVGVTRKFWLNDLMVNFASRRPTRRIA
jgi:hypothetical protein